MTHNIYSQQQLHHKSIARLKQIYSEIGASVEVSDKRCKNSWASAIAEYQSAQLQKVDEQATAQAELNSHIVAKAKAVAPEPLTPVEISFYHHEYYAGNELIDSQHHP
jgi:alcohol dehydrogenase YqhD (iron-dependent ADH family)